MKKFILAIIIFLASTKYSSAQKDNLQQSKWVQIMQNEMTGNFVEAEKDFLQFYNSYLKSKGIEERNESSSGEEHLESPTSLYISSFIRWSHAIRPFVREDGSIMTIVQRLVLINKNRQIQLVTKPQGQ